ncbi:MAG: hypothetical protein IJP48_04180 [Synergistaceae bacterium]|nr:hypothetical protein [Synergistaceae bacterium]
MGKIFGRFDKVIEYGQESIDSEFRAAHAEILDVTRGNGLWLWKPYIIYKTLEQVNNGDYIFYCDSGAFFFRSVSHFLKSINESKSDIWVTDIAFINRQWTKPKVFELLGISSREDIKNSRQVQGGFVFVRKSQESINFIREWLELVQRPELITPLRPDEDYGECIEHREDQSLLSIVSKLRGVKPHKEPYIAPSYHSFRELIKDLLGAKRVNAIKKFLGKKLLPPNRINGQEQ